MNDAIESYDNDGVSASLFLDYDCPSPIDNRWGDQIGTFYSKSGDIGERLGAIYYDVAQIIRESRFAGYSVIPLRYSDYGSSGATIHETSTDDANAFYQVSKNEIAKEWSGNRRGARKYMRGIVSELDRYLHGECYGYVVAATEAAYDDSCWGFIGEKYARSEMNSAVEYAREAVERERAERADMAARDIETVSTLAAL